MQSFDPIQMNRQVSPNIVRKNSYPILGTFAVPDDNLILLKIDVFDPQPDAFHQPQPAAIQQHCHNTMYSGHCLQQLFNFGLGQNSWQSFRTLYADRIYRIIEFNVQNLPVKKNNGIQGLVLS